MQKKLTVTLDEQAYYGLHRVIGHGRISKFIDSVFRPDVVRSDFESTYGEMALDDSREGEALEWSEATAEDVADAAR